MVDLVRAALNHREVWIREGRPGPLPAVLGSDGAGVVSEVGAGVDGVSVGDEVVINPSLDWGEREDAAGPDFRILGVPDQGTYAERIAIAAHQVRPRPAGWSWDECAALPLAGLTAWRALRLSGAGPGRRILVTGAGGGRRDVPRPDRRRPRARPSSQHRGQTPRLRERSSSAPRRRWTTTTRSGRSGSARSTPPSTAPAARAWMLSSGRSSAAASSSTSATRLARAGGDRSCRGLPRMARDPGDDDGEPARVRRPPGSCLDAAVAPGVDSTFPLEDAAERPPTVGPSGANRQGSLGHPVKHFVTADEIRQLAASGERELMLREHTVLTDAAVDAVRLHGIRMVEGSTYSTSEPRPEVVPRAAPGGRPSRPGAGRPGPRPPDRHATVASSVPRRVQGLSPSRGPPIRGRLLHPAPDRRRVGRGGWRGDRPDHRSGHQPHDRRRLGGAGRGRRQGRARRPRRVPGVA